MNSTKTAVLAAALLLSAAQAFADGGREHSKKEIKLLNDSAAALSSSHPDLSKRLKSYASKETGEKEEGANESTQAKGAEKDDINMLRRAADALQNSRPDLRKGLNRYAEKEEREQREDSKEHDESAPSGPGAPYGY